MGVFTKPREQARTLLQICVKTVNVAELEKRYSIGVLLASAPPTKLARVTPD